MIFKIRRSCPWRRGRFRNALSNSRTKPCLYYIPQGNTGIKIAIQEQTHHHIFSVKFFGTTVTVTVTVTSSASAVKRWLSTTLHLNRRHLHHLIVGLGVQWTIDNYHSHDSDPAADTLQLCIGRRCLIFQLSHANYVPGPLRWFLLNPNYTFVGFWTHSDERKLLISKHKLKLRVKPLDLRKCVVGWDGSDLSRACRERIMEECLGFKGYTFSDEIGNSDWNAKFLSPRQVLYACVDAYCAFEVGKKIRAWVFTR